MADLDKYTLIDGAKAIPLRDLPSEAWTTIVGDTSTKPEKLVSVVAFLYRSVDMRATAVASVPWTVKRNDTNILTSDDSTAPVASQYEWLRDLPQMLPRIEESLAISSAAYLFKLRNRVRILGLRWLMASSMKPIWGDSEIEKYERTRGGGKPPEFYTPDEIVHIWLQGTHETKPKTSPVVAAMNAAGVLHNADEFAKIFFERGAIKPFILGVSEMTQKKDRDEVEAFFNRFFSGIGNAFRAKTVNTNAMTVETVGEGLESLANKALTESMREDIATAMGVPHSLVLSNAANYATAQVDELGFYNRTILPECERIQRALNDKLLNPLGLDFSFDPQKMSIFQEDEEQRSSALEAYVRAGMPLPVAIEVLGVNLPEGVDPQQWESQPEPDNTEIDVQQRMDELERFKRWAKKRLNSKSFDPDQFESNLLNDADKWKALAELREDAGGADAPFPVASWEDYP